MQANTIRLLQQRLVGFRRAGLERRVGQHVDERHQEVVLVADRLDLVVRVEDLAFVEPQAFHDVLVGVRVDRLLERLPQQVLAALGRGDVAIRAEHDVVGGQRVGGDEEAQVALDDSRSSSVSPLGFFHSSMSRCMLTSCGIQWLAQPARYLSQAQRYLNGTSWLTSAVPLMTRLSSTPDAVEALGLTSFSVSMSCTGSRERMPPGDLRADRLRRARGQGGRVGGGGEIVVKTQHGASPDALLCFLRGQSPVAARFALPVPRPQTG